MSTAKAMKSQTRPNANLSGQKNDGLSCGFFSFWTFFWQKKRTLPPPWKRFLKNSKKRHTYRISGDFWVKKRSKTLWIATNEAHSQLGRSRSGDKRIRQVFHLVKRVVLEKNPFQRLHNSKSCQRWGPKKVQKSKDHNNIQSFKNVHIRDHFKLSSSQEFVAS